MGRGVWQVSWGVKGAAWKCFRLGLDSYPCFTGLWVFDRIGTKANPSASNTRQKSTLVQHRSLLVGNPVQKDRPFQI